MQIVGLGKMVGDGEVDEVDSRAGRRQAARRAAARRAARRRSSAARCESIAQQCGREVADRSEQGRRARRSRSIRRRVPLRPGMRFRGQVETERARRRSCQIPADAVFVTADGPVAYRERDGKLERGRARARRPQRDGDRGQVGARARRPGVAESNRESREVIRARARARRSSLRSARRGVSWRRRVGAATTIPTYTRREGERSCGACPPRATCARSRRRRSSRRRHRRRAAR